jgi:hypothetical protein
MHQPYNGGHDQVDRYVTEEVAPVSACEIILIYAPQHCFEAQENTPYRLP